MRGCQRFPLLLDYPLSYASETRRRRTFAIISHPDAGKTTLTEKLLLFSGAILFFTAALALRQAGLPAEIVTITFGAVVGALAIGVAVAVGVGGRHVAARLLERAVDAFDAPARAADADADAAVTASAKPDDARDR